MCIRDSVHVLAIAQRDGGQAGGVDLDDGHIVIAVAADDGGVVGVAIIPVSYTHLDVYKRQGQNMPIWHTPMASGIRK